MILTGSNAQFISTLLDYIKLNYVFNIVCKNASFFDKNDRFLYELYIKLQCGFIIYNIYQGV